MLAPTEKSKKMTLGKVTDLMKTFIEPKHKADIKLYVAEKTKLPGFEETCDEVIHMTEKQLTGFLGEAKICRKDKRATPLQMSTLASQAEIKERIKMCAIANQMLKQVGSQGYVYPSSFKNWVPHMKGKFWDIHSETIKEVTLHQVFFETDMHLRNWVVIIGLNGRGKSTLICALASAEAENYEFESYMFCKQLDPLGCATKTQVILQAGAFAFTDMNLVSLKDNVPLDMEELKSMAKVDEDGSFKARYYNATLPAGVPRIVAVNAGQRPDGGPKFDTWFLEQGLAGCAALVNDDAAAIKASSDAQQAVVRNTTVFTITDFLYEKDDKLEKKDPISSKFATRKFKGPMLKDTDDKKAIWYPGGSGSK